MTFTTWAGSTLIGLPEPHSSVPFPIASLRSTYRNKIDRPIIGITLWYVVPWEQHKQGNPAKIYHRAYKFHHFHLSSRQWSSQVVKWSAETAANTVCVFFSFFSLWSLLRFSSRSASMVRIWISILFFQTLLFDLSPVIPDLATVSFDLCYLNVDFCYLRAHHLDLLGGQYNCTVWCCW